MAEAELATIARPYARAAFSYALEQDSGLIAWSRMLQLLSAAVGEEVVRTSLDNPQLSGEDEAGLLISLLGDEISTEGQNFVNVLAGYDRVALLPEIADMYELLKANHEKTMEVEVTSAFEINEGEIQALSAALKNKLKRDINLETTIDVSLLGGVIIKAEDTVIDDSVRGKLQKMSNELS
jgi:F-type H+-transporting ATPase subunit delta